VRRLKVPLALNEARDGPSAEEVLRKLEPVHQPYHDLRRALARYRTLADEGGWPHVPDGALLRRAADAQSGKPATHDVSR
jgi:murein L,D-transpeptidase YcbB/YkuD